MNQLYLSAALLRAGVEVRFWDLAAPFGPRGVDSLVSCVNEWRPAIVGVTLCSETALASYRLVSALEPRDGLVTVAGGPHATAVPEEAIEHGFDVVVRGEGEETLVELVQAVANQASLERVRGLTYRSEDGQLHRTANRPHLRDLDELPWPIDGLVAAPRSWYSGDDGSSPLAATLLTSRGCPARCTFCSRQVGGRRYRFHSVARVVQELERWHQREQAIVFAFCDASFTVHRKRILALCHAMAALPFRPMWWCEARADQLDSELAKAMSKAGCQSVILGIESGDPGVQARTGKGIRLDVVVSTLQACKRAGLRTQVNFMLGFPDETVQELENTLRFMERIAPLVDLFSSMGIVAPYPGTPLYEQHHERLGFTRWWLDQERMRPLNTMSDDLPPGSSVDDVLAVHAAMEQAALDAHLIPYSDEVLQAIESCLVFRREQNRQRFTLGQP